MKKNGWGLKNELLFILLFLVCLAISTILLNDFGLFDDQNIVTGNNSYQTLESRLVSAAKDYVNEYYEGSRIESTKIVRYSTLYSLGYITKLTDGSGSACSGYVEVKRVDSSLIYTPYLKCDGYTTKNYSKNSDW